MSNYFKRGDEVFSPTGEAAFYIGRTPTGHHAVVPIYVSEANPNEEPRFGRVAERQDVYSEASVEKLSAEVQALTEKRADLSREITQLTRSLNEERRSFDALVANIGKKRPALERILDYIEGKISHYVLHRYDGVHILEFGKTKSDRDESYGCEFKLLTLYGYSRGDLGWRINHIDDYGGNILVYPQTSETEAIAFAQALQLQDIEKWRKDLNQHIGFNYLIDSCVRVGVEVPQDLADFAQAKKDQQIEDRRLKLEAELALIGKESA